MLFRSDVIRSSATEKYLDVVIDRSSKFSEQCILAARKGNTVLRMIKRNTHFKSKDVTVRLYKALARPGLNFVYKLGVHFLERI